MNKIIQKTSLTRTLFIFYILLLAIFGAIRIKEHESVQNIRKKMMETSTLSRERQNILNSISKSNDNILLNELKSLYYPKAEQRAGAEQKIRDEQNKIEHNLGSYRPLIRDSRERQLFGHMEEAEAGVQQKWNRISGALTAEKFEEARRIDREEVQPVFEKLQEANLLLAEHASLRDNAVNAQLKTGVDRMDKNAKIITCIIAGMALILGILIACVIRMIIRKTKMLGESERRYRTILEKTNEIILALSPEGKILSSNRKFKELIGYNDEELSALTIFDLMEKGPVDSFKRIFLVQGKDGAITEVFRILRAKDNSRVFIKGNISWEFDKGKLKRITGFFKDVTGKELLRVSLQESEKKFRHLFEMAPIPMYTFDPVTFRFFQVNNAALALYGYSKEEFLNLTVLDIRPMEEVSRTTASIDRIMKFRLDYYDNYKHIKKDSSLIDVQIFATRLSMKNVPVILATVIDITQRKLNENRITQAIIRAQEEERYEMGGELHDNVGQLLASAKMTLGIIGKELPQHVMEYYSQSMESISQATDEIRNLSHRLAPVFFKNSSLKESFNQLLRTFNIAGQYRISLYFDETVENLQIKQDLQLNLYRILQEQLKNIFKHAKAKEVKIEVICYKKKLQMLVSDDGVGFDPEVQSAGIGLANMKRRVEFFSGNIEINSAPGEGCEIVVSVPVEEISRQQSAA